MTTQTQTQTPLAALTAEKLHGRWSVRDRDGGVWHPDDGATTDIDADSDPATYAEYLCDTSPMRGRWVD